MLTKPNASGSARSRPDSQPDSPLRPRQQPPTPVRVMRGRAFRHTADESAVSLPFGQGPPERRPACVDPKYQLADDDREWVARVVDSLGPLTQRQRDALGRLLR